MHTMFPIYLYQLYFDVPHMLLESPNLIRLLYPYNNLLDWYKDKHSVHNSF